MQSDTPRDKLVVKFDTDGVITDIKETFLNCIDGGLEDYSDLEGYDLAEEVCEITNLAYKDRRDLLVPREPNISDKMENIRGVLEERGDREVELVVTTSREGINEEELEKSLKSMDIDNYDDARIEYDKWKNCDVLVEDNPNQVKAFLTDSNGKKVYHVNNECSKMVYGEREDIYEDERCVPIDSFSEIVEDIEDGDLFDESSIEKELATAKVC